MRIRILLCTVALALVAVAPARAQLAGLNLDLPASASNGVFRIDTNVNGVRTSMTFATVEDAFDALKNMGLSQINPAYTGTQAIQVLIDYRGVAITASYAAASSSTLVISVPSIGLVHTFDGGNRDASQQQLKDFFKQNQEDVLGRLSKDLARSSSIDPIAGNPNSLMARLVASDFEQGFFAQASTPVHGPANNLATVAPGYAQFRESGTTSRAYVLPLAYTIRSDDDPRRQFTIRVPIAEIDVAGSKSYQLGLGLSYSLPVTQRWVLTPAVSYAAAGSEDLGSLAGMASASLTSAYVMPFESFDLAVGDLVGYYKAMRIKSGSFGYDPHIANIVTRNGALISHDLAVAGRTFGMAYSFVDTYYFGDRLYVRHYDEVGVSVGNDRRKTLTTADMRVGVSWLFSPGAHGFTASIRGRF